MYNHSMERMRQVGVGLATAGAVLFIGVLFISAYWENDIRWLHFFQSWMYCAAIALMFKGSKWGLFIGFAAALLWDYANLFVTTFLSNGIAQVHILVRTGHLARPDQFISVPGWIGNFAVIVGCIVAYVAMQKKPMRDLLDLAVVSVGTTAFLALSMFIFQPRYLAIFPLLLHPHLHL